MKLVETSIPGVVVIEPAVHGDSRGYFFEAYNRARFAASGLPTDFPQANTSRSARGVLRGLHYQIRQPQGKLVRCSAGVIFDVAVDLRRASPRFGQWVGVELSGSNFRQLWVPPGFGHGFLVLSEFAEVQYKTTDYYAPAHERSVRWNDPAIGIDWPDVGMDPVLSAKDRQGLPLAEAEVFDR